LADRIDQLATDTTFYRRAVDQAQQLRHQYSWETLKPRYQDLFE
jgi:hypothetical protein